LNSDDKKTLIKYRLERSEESLAASKLMLDNGLYVSAMNRIYYSMFYTVQALLILNDVSFSKHGQVKGFFNKEYIKTNILQKDFGRLYNVVFEYRQKFDYVDLIIPERDLIVDYVDKAEFFNKEVSKYILSVVSKL